MNHNSSLIQTRSRRHEATDSSNDALFHSTHICSNLFIPRSSYVQMPLINTATVRAAHLLDTTLSAHSNPAADCGSSGFQAQAQSVDSLWGFWQWAGEKYNSKPFLLLEETHQVVGRKWCCVSVRRNTQPCGGQQWSVPIIACLEGGKWDVWCHSKWEHAEPMLNIREVAQGPARSTHLSSHLVLLPTNAIQNLQK